MSPEPEARQRVDGPSQHRRRMPVMDELKISVSAAVNSTLTLIIKLIM